MTIQAVESRTKLVALLQLAYSGELAAAHAYRGHWKSVRNAEEKTAIQSIENDEWRHRKLVGEMLVTVASRPSQRRETRREFNWPHARISDSWNGMVGADVWRGPAREPKYSRVRNRRALRARMRPQRPGQLPVGDGGSRVGP